MSESALNLTAIDQRVNTLIEWLVWDGATNGHVLAVLLRALAIGLDSIPLEQRTERTLVLARALDAALDELDEIMQADEDADPVPAPVTKQ